MGQLDEAKSIVTRKDERTRNLGTGLDLHHLPGSVRPSLSDLMGHDESDIACETCFDPAQFRDLAIDKAVKHGGADGRPEAMTNGYQDTRSSVSATNSSGAS